MSDRPTRVMCVDDNEWIGESIQRILRRHTDLAWAGWLATASGLAGEVDSRDPDVLLLDIDIPGEDPFDALASLAEARPEVRVIMLSGHVRAEYIDRALAAGAWGYISKNDETDSIVSAIRQAMAGEVALSPVVAAELARG